MEKINMNNIEWEMNKFICEQIAIFHGTCTANAEMRIIKISRRCNIFETAKFKRQKIK